jgi:hypothetical protein
MKPLSDGELIKEPLSALADTTFPDKKYDV